MAPAMGSPNLRTIFATLGKIRMFGQFFHNGGAKPYGIREFIATHAQDQDIGNSGPEDGCFGHNMEHITHMVDGSSPTSSSCLRTPINFPRSGETLDHTEGNGVH
jgi:hypothetical protein